MDSVDFSSVQTLVAILQGVLIIAIAVLVARLKGRAPIFWGLLALFFGIYALFFLALLPQSRKEKDQTKKEEGEQEKKLGEPSGQKPKENHVPPPLPVVPSETMTEEQLGAVDWFYVGADKSIEGPFSLSALRERASEKKIHEESWIWCELFPNWKRIKTNQVISELLFGKKEQNS